MPGHFDQVTLSNFLEYSSTQWCCLEEEILPYSAVSLLKASPGPGLCNMLSKYFEHIIRPLIWYYLSTFLRTSAFFKVQSCDFFHTRIAFVFPTIQIPRFHFRLTDSEFANSEGQGSAILVGNLGNLRLTLFKNCLEFYQKKRVKSYHNEAWASHFIN